MSVLGRLLALWLGGSVSDRWGRVRVLVPGLLAYAALLGSLPLMSDPIALGLWSVAIGMAGRPPAGGRLRCDPCARRRSGMLAKA